ncbi:hypothetical protein [Streptomyces sp. NPDC053048]|uniref:hypothetical protein n=1 Tax=Streptomyces sp. NPDC053048 TaxID=3365694 RepID=UPI0037D6345B
MSRRPTRTVREQARADRRDRIDILLARYARHAPAEAALLRSLVEAEITEGDRFRREAGGQQAAVRREQQRVAAAEAAIVEAEQRAEAAEQALDACAYRDRLAEELLDRPTLLGNPRPASLDRLLDHVAEQLDHRAQQ